MKKLFWVSLAVSALAILQVTPAEACCGGRAFRLLPPGQLLPDFLLYGFVLPHATRSGSANLLPNRLSSSLRTEGRDRHAVRPGNTTPGSYLPRYETGLGNT